MQLEYAIEGYWLAKRRDFSPNTVNDYTLTFRRLITARQSERWASIANECITLARH